MTRPRFRFPSDPRDRWRWYFGIVCGAIALAVLGLLIATGHAAG
jgi:hypothetical protein